MRASDVVTLSVVGAVAAFVVGCTSTAHRSSPSGAMAAETPSAVSSAGRPVGSRQIVYFADVVRPDLMLVAVGPGPDGGSRPRLLATAVGGRQFREVGPRVPVGDYPDSVYFLNQQYGWLTTFAGGGGAERLYRTTDAGNSWQSFPLPPHSLAAGSTDAVQFTTAQDGWLVDVQPTGPGETLYRSHDGGRSWQPVADLDPSKPDNGRLPRLGLVAFEPDNRLGWLGGGPAYWGGLYLSRDLGQTWQAAGIPGLRRATVALPTIHGSTVLETATRCAGTRTTVDLYVSTDNGAHWTARPPAFTTPGVPAGYTGTCTPVSTTFPSSSVGWATALSRGRILVTRTTDQGRHWKMINSPDLAPRATPSIGATDSTHAWLQVPGIDVHGTRLYITSDGGHTWRRIDQLAVR